MEVVDACSAHLSDREILDLLSNNTSKKQTNLATILYETTSYLESSPAATYSLANLVKFSDAIKECKFDLTKIEKIQILNVKPQNEIELNLIVDNMSERFTEDQKNDLLNLVQTLLEKPLETEDNPKKKLKLY